jgi:flagellar M-ring protein FliF
VNDRLTQPASKNHPAVWQRRSADEVRNLTALAQAAVGFDASRGDVLTIEDLAFDDNLPQPGAAVPQQIVNAAENSPVLVKYVALLIGLVVVVAFGLRAAMRRAGAALAIKGSARGARELPARTAAPDALAPPKLAEEDPERLRTQEIFEQVTTHLKREPTQSSRLLQSWIHSE